MKRTRTVWSLRWIAASLAVVLAASSVLAVGALAERHARAMLRHEIEERLRLQARNLALGSAGALLGDFPELTLHPLVRSMQAQDPDLALAVVVDHRGLVQGHADARTLGTPFQPPAGLHLGSTDVLQPSGALLVAATPVRGPDGHVIGTALVGLPLRYIDQAVESSRRQQALVLALCIALAALAALLLMSQLLRPVTVLRAGLERIGRGDLDTPIVVHDRTELGLLADTVNGMASALKGAQAEMLERERLAHEVELAREIQRSLLPAGAVTAGRFVVHGDQRAATEVGGDYWDVLRLPDGRLGLVVADVSGKGLGGCLVMSMLSALLRAAREHHASPASLLATLDDQLAQSLRPGVFVTMCYAVLDPSTGRLTFASAGHNPLVLWRARAAKAELCSARGIPLGAVRGGAVRATVREETLVLEPGDVCVLFTDGYSEAFREGGEELFGMERFQETVARSAPEGGEAVLASLREAVRAWAGEGPPNDDETVLVLASSPATETEEALSWLDRAGNAGAPLVLPTRLDGLAAMDGWVGGLARWNEFSGPRRETARSALYEILANIAEHGDADLGRACMRVWWLPAGEGEGDVVGRFVVLDDAGPFRPASAQSTDFTDPAVRMRGRGLGTEIIRRALAAIAHFPATPRGNVTLLTLGRQDPVRDAVENRS